VLSTNLKSVPTAGSKKRCVNADTINENPNNDIPGIGDDSTADATTMKGISALKS
jgi:hypothetical protein